MKWHIRVDRRVVKQLKRLEPEQLKQVLDRLRGLATEPRPQGCKQLRNSQVGGWRIRIGKLRVLYTIDDHNLEVNIYFVGPRDQVYRKPR